MWKGLEWQNSTQRLTGQLRMAEQEELQTRSQLNGLAEVLPGDEQPLPLTGTLVNLLAVLNGEQLNNRVEIGPITSADASGSTLSSLLEMAQPVNRTELYSLTLSIRGTYREYAGLKRYLEQVQAQPGAITRLQILGDTFALEIKILGTL